VTIHQTPRKAAQAFIFVTLVFDTLGMGIASPVMPKLVGELTGGDAARVAEVFGVFGTLFFVGVFFGAPVQGALSDSYGRRPVILISCFVTALDYAIVALAPNLGWFYVGRALVGLAAGNIAASIAYLIDVTPPEERVRMFSFAGAAANVGIAFGPAIGGIAGTYSLRLPFWIAVGLCLVNALYGLFVLPESLPPEKRSRFSWRNTNPVSSMTGILRDYPIMLKWFAVIVLANLAQLGANSIFPVYLSYRYNWSPIDLSIYMSYFGFMSIFLQAAVIPGLTLRFKDLTLLGIGAVLQSLAIALCGLSPFGLGYVGFATLWGLGSMMLGAITNGFLSQSIGQSDQGRVQGAARSLSSLVGLVAPGLFAFMLATGIRLGGKPFSGIAYVVSGVLSAIAALMILDIVRKNAKR
jgi:DHA1 family tetracycline resistance protein-like MFS transporter